MIWNAIGQSVLGTSHFSLEKECEDSIFYKVIDFGEFEKALICFASDGAGSAKFAKEASEITVNKGVAYSELLLAGKVSISDNDLIQIAENIYEDLKKLSEESGEVLNEYSCTLLGCIILPEQACFLQIGDGAIVRADETGFFSVVWWPHNGEYQNTTAFLVDDPNFSNLKVKIVEERILEVGMFTDGLQMLALNNETETVHQPFLVNLFKALRLARNEDHLSILNNKLIDYLSGDTINSRTDDDKTLFISTRIKNDSTVV